MWSQDILSSSGKVLCIGCFLLLAFLAVSGCSSSGSGPSHGFFIDNTVEGLTYNTETMSGETDSQGRFSFEPGEKVTFSIGGIILGTAAAQNIITPLDLVNGAQDEKNPSVTNITRLLITLDEDSNPENGITIRPELGVSLAGISVDFGMDPDEFAVDDDVLNVISIVNDLYTEADEGERTLCTVQDAQDHLAKTLDELAESDYEHYTHGGGGGGGGGSGGCG
jgi:hypothetical protein